MANISRFSPMRPFERLSAFDELERMLEAFRMRPIAGSLTGSMAGGGDMRVDVGEDDHSYFIKAEMPGLTKDDIKISVEGNQVSIAAEVKQEPVDPQCTSLCAERFYGQLYRAFMLDHAVDDAKAEAKYENGVLTLVLPKKFGGASHKVSVH